jgi:hypothetical protein
VGVGDTEQADDVVAAAAGNTGDVAVNSAAVGVCSWTFVLQCAFLLVDGAIAGIDDDDVVVKLCRTVDVDTSVVAFIVFVGPTTIASVAGEAVAGGGGDGVSAGSGGSRASANDGMRPLLRIGECVEKSVFVPATDVAAAQAVGPAVDDDGSCGKIMRGFKVIR